MRGSVIIPVLIVLVLLAFVAAETGRSLTTDYGGAAYMRGAFAAGWPLDDAEYIAIRTLEADGLINPDVDTPFEAWNKLSDDLDVISASGSARLEGGITDLGGLFPINRLNSRLEPKTSNRIQYEAIFLRLLNGLQQAYGVDGDPQKFLDSLRYWIGDPIAPRNDEDVYGEHDPPYERPRRLLAYPQELALVHWEGVDEKDVRKLMLGEDGHPGLANFVTTWGGGKINMNTAPEAIVRAVCPVSDKADPYWAAVKLYRSAESNDFGKTWYLDLAEGLKMDKTSMPSHCLWLNSSAYAIHLRCYIGGMVRRQLTIVTRRADSTTDVVFRQSY